MALNDLFYILEYVFLILIREAKNNVLFVEKKWNS